ncbi:hypothetical protein MIND_00110200 [Mycena indigotica]|uniref:Uncharacterized protein n=1 Tax=Mycena indigotica TaxID=2126181 RepID=A0A8H6TES9_9AGAR|nr:uncharacterized protein MIND_00110200 [Mycena indigotica]KAF7315934.1 hypothetical protein MIND_00110200 [Mycena indigotica]
MSLSQPHKKGLGDLPYELEREIFELTARAFPEFAPQLTLVCKYVQAWVEAVIYETIVLSFKHDRFLDTFSARPPSFFARTTRHLHIATGISHSQARKLLETCTSLTSLTCWSSLLTSIDELSALLSSFPYLRRLSIDASFLWNPVYPPAIDHPLFSKLTHLEVVNPPWWFDWTPLLALPPLTHLAFGDLDAAHAAEPCNILEFFARALESEVPQLEMLIAVSANEQFLREVEDARLGQNLKKSGSEGKKDERFVCLSSYHSPLSPLEFWKGVSRLEVDFWSQKRSEWEPKQMIQYMMIIETMQG